MAKETDVIKLLFLIRTKLYEDITEIYGSDKVSKVESLILFFIKNNPNCKISDIASELGIPNSTLTGILDRMVEKGFVDRERGASDRRSVVLNINKNYYKKFKDNGQPAIKYMREKTKELPEGWMDEFEKSLRVFYELLDNRGGKGE